MKLRDQIKVEPLDEERLTNIERRLVVGVSELSMKRAPRRGFVLATSGLLAVAAAAAGEVLHGNPASRSEQILGGQTYQVFEVDTSRWSVLWARTLIDTSWVLKQLSAESIRSIAIAIPCLLLPVWFAVMQGLRPLRQFSDRIAARGPNDMSPLGGVPKQTEMKPLAAEVLIVDGNPHLVRRRQTFEDLIRGESIPKLD